MELYALYNITNTTAACLYDDDTMTIATTVAVKPAEKKPSMRNIEPEKERVYVCGIQY